ncbi:MAG: Ku protein [Chloroflexi bacterium]|nr:MAG: Ku protein [Chloroflexota bacterium]
MRSSPPSPFASSFARLTAWSSVSTGMGTPPRSNGCFGSSPGAAVAPRVRFLDLAVTIARLAARKKESGSRGDWGMPRSIWKGVMSFGMVAIPVRLYLATESSSKVSFNLLCPEHRSRIKNKRWCVEGDHEVAWGDVVRGYEYEKGNYVELTDEDLEKLPLRSSKAIDITGFIKDEELPGALYYQSAYYLEPEKSAEKPYALLNKTLEKTGRVAIAKFALRDRERLVSVRPLDGALLMNTLHWPDEIRSTEDLDVPEDVKVSPAELKMAENLVGMMASEFEPSEYKDEYKQAVLKLVEAKVQKKEVIEAPEPEAETTVVDLMSALKASVEKAKKGEAKTKRAAASSSRTARKKAS